MMWTWISSVLLSTLVVIGSSFPHPDEYQIPDVGRGGRSGSQRSQYYVLHSDGTFKYGYDTAEGAFESTMLNDRGNQNGQFGYVDPDGNHIHLQYEAGAGGFVARGDHLPVPSPELAKAIADVVARSKPFIDPLAGEFGDRSYGFKFDSDDHSRTETSDSDGTVTGSYSYVDEFGHKREFTYKAGKGIGFVIEGDSLTAPAPLIPSVRQSSQTRTRVTKPRSRVTKPVSRNPRPTTRTAAQPGKPLNRATYSDAFISSSQSQTPGDASYSFSYSADDHSRRETSDKDLNVEGSFSFIADDGNQRSVSYVAGRDTGFQAVGKHLPIPPVGDFGARTRSSSSRGSSSRTKVSQRKTQRTQPARTHTLKSSVAKPAKTYYTQPESSITQTQRKPSISSQSFSSFTPSNSFEAADIRSTSSDDGSYSVYYDAGTHSRTEEGDSDNRVEGEFSFVAEDDGDIRKLSYEAGRDTGFIVEGDHLPVGPSVPGASSGVPTGRLEKVTSVNYVDPLAGSDRDASYSFGFDSDTYSRSESSDADGNVKGTYTVVDDDGTIIKYEFKAGKGIGFETTEVSRTQGPVPVKPTPYKAPASTGVDLTRATYSTKSTSSAVGNRFSAPAQVLRKSKPSFVSPIRPFEEANIRSSTSDDGSYSFSYGSRTHSRSESGDSNNNVNGEFSFISDDDDELRRIVYEAGADTGFIAEGAHIPTGPIVPGSPSGQPTGRLERVSSTPFFDPLARSNTGAKMDASYSFGFDSDDYSRTESADEDGNVVGTYTVVDSDGTVIKYKYKAGKGIGFQPEEVSRTLGSGVGKPLSSSSSATQAGTRTSGFSSGSTSASRTSGSSAASRTSGSRTSGTRTSGSRTSGSTSGSRTSGVSAASRTSGTASGTRTSGSFSGASRTSGYKLPTPSSRFSHGVLKKSSFPSGTSRTSKVSAPKNTHIVKTDDFELRQYPASGDKFGYVIKYD